MSPHYLKGKETEYIQLPQPVFMAKKCFLHLKWLVSESDNKLKNGFFKRLFCLSVHVASAGRVIKLEFRRSVGFQSC